ncbi:MAG: 3,4-dihydroxy-2-butanone-4-phosphate synthase [Deltaproteobacteria bacterium]|nr:3,4-dihydroxy-2-butanone-4-phosphate synthase [Deltaproteobacteria bacterium]
MLTSIKDAIEVMRAGRMLIMVDDEDRENEGDIVAAAQSITPEQIAFMAKHARGLICLAMSTELCDGLGLNPMTAVNTAPLGTAFTVSIDAREGISSGISASDRATTIRKAADPAAVPSDFVSPGSVFPLRAVPGGVLVRTGQTEGSVDLARLAGLNPVAVICEVLREDGTMMRLPELLKFGKERDLPVISVADVIAHRLQNETFVEEVAQAELPTDFGGFKVHAFKSDVDKRAHLALVMGEINPDEPVLVRVHRANFPGDTFEFSKGRGRADVKETLTMIAGEGRGIFLYLNREETGADLLASIDKVGRKMEDVDYLEAAISEESHMTFRDFGIGAQILRELGAARLRIITSHPRHFSGLGGFGLEVDEFVKLPETT